MEQTEEMKSIGFRSKSRMTLSSKTEEMKIVSKGRKKIRRLSMLPCCRSKWQLSQSRKKMTDSKYNSKK